MQAVINQRGGVSYRWLFSKKIDLSIFYLPIGLGVVGLALLHSNFFASAVFFSFLIFQAFGLSDFHIGATWFHYFDRRNWHFYTQSANNRLIYLWMPLGWIAAATVAQVYAPKMVFSLFLLWTIQHLVQQNVGILLLHHNHGDARVERNLEVRTQHWAAIAFSLVFVRRLYPHNQIYDVALQLLIAASAIVATVLAAKYVASLQRQVREGAALNVPALGFWLLSVLFIAPATLVNGDLRESLLIPQMVHWFQYVGLNLVLVSRKYSSEASAKTALPSAQAMVLFVFTGATIATAMMLGYWSTDAHAAKFPAYDLVVGALYGMGFAHYWQDAFIWKFREQFNREMMLPFLKPAVAKVAPPVQEAVQIPVGSGRSR